MRTEKGKESPGSAVSMYQGQKHAKESLFALKATVL